jgi:putative protease
VLTDRLGVQFPIVCSGGFSQILNSRPIYMADRLREIKNVDYMVLYFTLESKSQCADIMQAYKEAKKPEGEFTRGLYYRGVE